MIYTVTLNPALDYIIQVDNLKLGSTNRSEGERILPGGKGINVSRVLKNLGVESKNLGFVAGFTGEEIKRSVKDWGLEENFIKLPMGTSRINVKLRSKEETEINARGPEISERAVEELFARLEELEKGDVLVLSGSVPKNLSDTIYQNIIKKQQGKGIQVVLDTSGEALLKSVSYHPFLIKPNRQELEEIFHKPFSSIEKIVSGARELRRLGAENVLVSLAGEGALLITEEDEIISSRPPEGKVHNSVGAGDSMVAGFLYGLGLHGDMEEAFSYGLCAGSASAFSEELATGEEIESCKKKREEEDDKTGLL